MNEPARIDPRYQGFPAGFFGRWDDSPDDRFYDLPRMVTHIDDGAIAAVSALYDELRVPDGVVLDLMSSWVSHQPRRPRRLVVLGMNLGELECNEHAHEAVLHDLNAQPELPLPDASFDYVTCCVSVDYLTRPIEVFDEVARVLRPGGLFVCTFSNRCFPSKAIQGWLGSDDRTHCAIVGEYFRRSGQLDEEGRLSPAWSAPTTRHCNAGLPGDPLFAVWAQRLDYQSGRATLGSPTPGMIS